MSDPDRLAGVTQLSTWIASREDDRVEAWPADVGGASTDRAPADRAVPHAMPSARLPRHDEQVSDDSAVVDAEAAQPVDEDSARSIALRALGRRAASRQELDRTLERRDVQPEVRETVLDRLAEEGLVDDTQLAQDLAERLRERKHLGERGIAAELRKRGLDPESIERSDDDEELRRAIDAAADRRRRMGSLDDVTAERRLHGFLQRRGFGGSTVRTAIERTRPGGPRFR